MAIGNCSHCALAGQFGSGWALQVEWSCSIVGDTTHSTWTDCQSTDARRLKYHCVNENGLSLPGLTTHIFAHVKLIDFFQQSIHIVVPSLSWSSFHLFGQVLTAPACDRLDLGHVLASLCNATATMSNMLPWFGMSLGITMWPSASVGVVAKLGGTRLDRYSLCGGRIDRCGL